MSDLNRLANAKNPFQGDAKKVLCVCSAGLLRSPTAAVVLQKTYGYNTRAAGCTRDFALIHADQALLYWADEIVCVSGSVKAEMDHLFEDDEIYKITDVTTLAVPDRYKYMDHELQKIILKQYAEATEKELSTCQSTS